MKEINIMVSIPNGLLSEMGLADKGLKPITSEKMTDLAKAYYLMHDTVNNAFNAGAAPMDISVNISDLGMSSPITRDVEFIITVPDILDNKVELAKVGVLPIGGKQVMGLLKQFYLAQCMAQADNINEVLKTQLGDAVIQGVFYDDAQAKYRAVKDKFDTLAQVVNSINLITTSGVTLR